MTRNGGIEDEAHSEIPPPPPPPPPPPVMKKQSRETKKIICKTQRTIISMLRDT